MDVLEEHWSDLFWRFNADSQCTNGSCLGLERCDDFINGFTNLFNLFYLKFSCCVTNSVRMKRAKNREANVTIKVLCFPLVSPMIVHASVLAEAERLLSIYM